MQKKKNRKKEKLKNLDKPEVTYNMREIQEEFATKMNNLRTICIEPDTLQTPKGTGSKKNKVVNRFLLNIPETLEERRARNEAKKAAKKAYKAEKRKKYNRKKRV